MSTTSTDDHKFVSPVSRNTETTTEKVQSEKSEAENSETKVSFRCLETPIAVRTRRHFQQELHLSSPSDAQLSPCTTKLFGKGGRKVRPCCRVNDPLLPS
ncbi:unnamed protein product [Heligmosomoides polygyrus]|uniref:Uncharacterized protein n=1 Tax=Heligmosomoides polygyrus TaxID=6339 RepID=A0A183G9M7_HELPZ|nr:unnamed protein product [Heligmosomoides polygyrus]